MCVCVCVWGGGGGGGGGEGGETGMYCNLHDMLISDLISQSLKA